MGYIVNITVAQIIPYVYLLEEQDISVSALSSYDISDLYKYAVISKDPPTVP